ncbi:cobalamin biosynthetic protein CobC [Pseudorhizobium tarimense]|uniref:threonine-phosphate decarboxylase n=1 Tax=Pseudorhizobium tarimense TaxID=1079109 RepID=A0ABV2H4U8_9HYPH|nr:threonine-phosphate decarboxylase CobD [Pseudorhizobium tarimense]MCJ8518781.1 threonine-phosphate decarboxylase CobD [Pseudorhizobium tarimense]
MRKGGSELDGAIQHGGNLGRARQEFPSAPEPWIDLSTGINPYSYPHSPIPAKAFLRLPELDAVERLKGLAAAAYGAPSPAHIAVAPGTQILLPMLARLRATRGSAAILSPTYAEHAKAASQAGYQIKDTEDLSDLEAADLAIVVNPNNPTGRLLSRSALVALAITLAKRGGLLIVDEAFGEVSTGDSVADVVGDGGLVVLRSFGKFFGMAGLRLGFALASPHQVRQLEDQLGPWAVSGPALHIATEALSDDRWKTEMKQKLREEAQRLDCLLQQFGILVAGGTSLFRYARHESAGFIYEHLGRHGILIRKFDGRPVDLRIGLPHEHEWDRLKHALAQFRL